MRYLSLLLALPALIGAAPPRDNYDATALLECRQTRDGADTVRQTLKELTHSGRPGGYEYSYDVAKLRPLGTAKPKLSVELLENQYGYFDEYTVLLNGQYPAVLKKLLQAHGVSACTKSTAQSCQFSAGEAEVELALNAKKELVLTCGYEGNN